MICKDNVINSQNTKGASNSLIIPDWTSLDITTPFYNQKTNRYYITIDTGLDFPKTEQLSQVLEDAKRPGIIGLLSVYGRIQEANVDFLLKFAESSEWHVPSRPNPRCGPNNEIVPLFGTKVLVSVPADKLNGIPRLPITNNNVDLPQPKQEITLFSGDLKSSIKTASNKIRNYGTDAVKIKGSLALDFGKEADRLENFVSVLENLLIANGFSLHSEQNDLIILGIDKNNKRI
jgi:hypothetical protein